MRPAFQLLGYYLSLVVFGASGFALTIFCGLTAWVPGGPRTERFFQRVIHRAFGGFLEWVRLLNLIQVRYHRCTSLPPEGCVIAANHPGLMDVVFLLAWIPEAWCVFKPSIGRNPVLGAAARRAGYVGGCDGTGIVRRAVARLRAGNSLVIFPEGTRTPPGGTVGACKPGFVLMARRAGVPIQLVRIGWDSNILVKARPWWKLPRLPAHITVTLGPRLHVATEADPGAVAEEIAAWWRAAPATAACHAWSGHVTVQPVA